MRESAETNEKTAGKAIGELIFLKRAQKGWTQFDLAVEAFGENGNPRRIVELENGQIARPQARNIGLLAKALGITDEELKPCWALKSVGEKTQKKLGLSSNAIEKLARTFGQDSPDGSFDQLVEFLEIKATELRLLKDRMTALGADDDNRRSLLIRAQTAIEEGSFDEAEEILELCEREHQDTATLVQVRKQAAIRAMRASNELLKGDSYRAFEHFSAAAKFFDPFDKIEGAIIRDDFHEKLHWHGRFFGGKAFDFAEQLLILNLTVFASPTDEVEWARAQSSLGRTKQFRGMRATGDEGIEILRDAINCFELALDIFNRDVLPGDWVKAFTNRAIALRFLGSRLGIHGGIDYLNMAVVAYETLLVFRADQAPPSDLARSHTNLAVALTESAKLVDGDLAFSLLRRAIHSCESALLGYPEELHPENWARTMVNMGNAYHEYGSKVLGEERQRMLNNALQSYERALQHISQQHHRVLWAETMEDIGLAHESLATYCEEEFAHHTAQALTAFNQALTVYDSSLMDHYYSKCAAAIARVLLTSESKFGVLK